MQKVRSMLTQPFSVVTWSDPFTWNACPRFFLVCLSVPILLWCQLQLGAITSSDTSLDPYSAWKGWLTNHCNGFRYLWSITWFNCANSVYPNFFVAVTVGFIAAMCIEICLASASPFNNRATPIRPPLVSSKVLCICFFNQCWKRRNGIFLR